MSRAPPPSSSRRLIRVASLPSRHVYVRHLSDPDGGDLVARLPEPFRDGPPGASWYPSPMLDPAWIRRSAADFDLMHVHFGFDHLPAGRLETAMQALREAGKPLVFTVHDLRNPHHHDPGPHDRALGVLIPAAEQLITLTPGAAAAIAERWGRDAVVAPHPHVVPLERLEEVDHPERGPFTVGVHLKNVRANMLTLPVVDAAREAVEAIGDGARLQVNVHSRVATPGDDAHAPDLMRALERLAARPGVDLRVRPFFSDEELWSYLRRLDVSVLPYRFGTHSGWLEACHDLGTTVVAPTCGFYHQQRPVVPYRADSEDHVRGSLPEAIRRAHAAGPAPPATLAGRRVERAALARLHRRVYERALGWS